MIPTFFALHKKFSSRKEKAAGETASVNPGNDIILIKSLRDGNCFFIAEDLLASGYFFLLRAFDTFAGVMAVELLPNFKRTYDAINAI